MRRLLSLVLVGILVAAACTADDGAEPGTTTAPTTSTTVEEDPTTPDPGSTTTTGATTVIPVELQLAAFGALDEIPVLDDDLPYAGPPTPTSLDDVVVHGPLVDDLDEPALRAMLAEQGFAVVPGDARLFHHVYQPSEYDPYPVFVTTDAAYHVWHLAFDKVLRDTEQERLLPALERLVEGLVERSRAQRDEYAGTPLADAADRVAQFYEVAATLLELDVGPIGPLAQEEVQLALAADSARASPTVGMVECTAGSGSCVFYETFRPRGHYTRSPELERYFRAMSLLGNAPFPLDEQSLTVGMMAVRPLLADEQAVADWRLVYEPTAFLVGAADDYTPFDLAAVARAVNPEGLDGSEELAASAALQEMAERLRAMRPVMINAEDASVRVLGSRFTLDSYVIDQLVDPNVGERLVASAHDVAAAFGSDLAYATMEADGYTQYTAYDEQLAELRDLVAERTMDDWGRTVYDAWLYALAPMWSPHGAAFPDLMQTEAWAAKAHQTGFGSYTELKHDTILYTKQAIAQGGDDGEPPPPPRHWVEPDPVAFERIAAAARLLREGLAERDLISADHSTTLEQIEQQLADLARIARDELAGRSISDVDNEQLQWFGAWLESMWLATSDLSSLGEDGGPDEDAALVADIMRSETEGALELATGKVDRIYVLVPDDGGTFQVAMGGVYSFYEFWQDPAARLTDEEWRVLLDSGRAPARPTWTEPFLVSD